MTRNKKSRPVFIHPNIEVVAGEISDLFKRLDVYGAAYKKAGGEFPLLLCCAMSKKTLLDANPTQYRNLEIIRICNSGKNLFYFIFRVFKCMQTQGIKPSILVSGDLKNALFSSIMIRFLFRRKVPIQISLHGFPSLQKFPSAGKVNKFYLRLLKLSTREIDSIRVVSNSLANFAREKLAANNSKIFLAPIPIISPPKFKDKKNLAPTIGVIGRLHHERGIEEVLTILSNLNCARPEIQVFIIGDGNQRLIVQRWHQGLSNPNRVHLVGGVSQSQLHAYWEKINILLSAASSEGYGLALREALISGAAVVAKKSEGTKELVEQYGDGVILFEDSKSAFEILLKLVDDMKNLPVINGAGKVQETLDGASLLAISRSWMST